MPLSVALALRRRKGLTVITNNLSAALASSDEMTNRIILPGGELRLLDRDILGKDVLAFLAATRPNFVYLAWQVLLKMDRYLSFMQQRCSRESRLEQTRNGRSL